MLSPLSHSSGIFLLFALSGAVTACDTGLGLGGTEVVKGCNAEAQTCIPSSRAVYAYAEAYPDSDSEVSISLASSPWHLYGPDGRMMQVEELAAVIRPHINEATERVVLLGSWTGGGDRPLAQRLSKALDGMPVLGADGFLWLSPDGSTRLTKQAYTARNGSGYYEVAEGDEVLVPLAHGWAAGMEQRFIDGGDAELLLHAAIGWDVFYLCREKALDGFELAAEHGVAIAAYNAALMRIERNEEGDRAAARRLLEQAASQGDTKSRDLLAEMND
ncbi:MAG: hypothetical protein ABS41_08805 [Arenimonas sp. SCN 70-307]|uniref:hypothetical protein n=1 Tax=Arenimonas sp. SCN 70-307 TaxID=1660089 RepID=UPI00086F09E4|nr:hypothetical protein [Arenimonas sp. SCN 70-307]ODS63244.1 MAG: hypothetical protein ABS41_08805 [Arenimonas sp. SCN 70-307]